MRDIPVELAARIENGAAGLCHVWILTRADGVRMGFTDHDRALSLDGVDCRAASGWTAGAVQTEAGTEPGSFSVSGALDDSALTEADIAAGLYDGARVETFVVDWSDVLLRVRMSVATLARIKRGEDRFEAELEGPMAALDRVVGRTYGRGCDAVFGDGRCRIDRSDFPDQDCDKAWATCVGQFGNGVNFQGFVDIPGDDFLTAYPREGGRNDGGSRR